MQCHYYRRGECRSCALLEMPYADQLARKEAAVRDHINAQRWLPAVESPEAGFRNKAKMAVGGTVDQPTLGILDDARLGVDISECPLYEEAITASLPTIREFITRASLRPFSVPTGRGELKNVLITASPAGRLMVRFVLRSTEAVVRIRKHMPWLMDRIPCDVLTANILPARTALLEGDEEIVLTPTDALRMDLAIETSHASTSIADAGPIDASSAKNGPIGATLPDAETEPPEAETNLPETALHNLSLDLRPQSFFQTNTGVTRQLYSQARAWVKAARPDTLWDLYCGVGGFAMACAGIARTTLGVEVSTQAVESARTTAARLGIDTRFIAADAATVASSETYPDLAIVNPPRRGIGTLASWLENSPIETLIYSSCNPVSLAKDLANMPSFAVTEARVFDMFPHTDHVETLCLLARNDTQR